MVMMKCKEMQDCLIEAEQDVTALSLFGSSLVAPKAEEVGVGAGEVPPLPYSCAVLCAFAWFFMSFACFCRVFAWFSWFKSV